MWEQMQAVCARRQRWQMLRRGFAGEDGGADGSVVASVGKPGKESSGELAAAGLAKLAVLMLRSRPVCRNRSA